MYVILIWHSYRRIIVFVSSVLCDKPKPFCPVRQLITNKCLRPDRTQFNLLSRLNVSSPPPPRWECREWSIKMAQRKWREEAGVEERAEENACRLLSSSLAVTARHWHLTHWEVKYRCCLSVARAGIIVTNSDGADGGVSCLNYWITYHLMRKRWMFIKIEKLQMFREEKPMTTVLSRNLIHIELVYRSFFFLPFES